MIRIVKMTFQAEKVPAFLEKFNANKQHIRHFEGVEHLSLLKDKKQVNVFFTYSHWQSEAHLENYRKSAFFKQFWSELKPYFAAKAEAWSVDAIEILE